MKSIAVLLLLSSVTFWSCNQSVRIVEPPVGRVTSGTVALTFPRPPAGVASVRATLSRPGYDSLFLYLTINDSIANASGTLNDVPPGVWHLRVDAFDDAQKILYTGQTDVNVLAGQTTSAELALLPAGGGTLEIHVTWGQQGDTDITTGLALRFPFDGNLTDASGNGNDGLSSMPIYIDGHSGSSGSAFAFAGGTLSQITVANAATLNPTNQLTVAFWLKVDSIAANYMDILTKSDTAFGYFNNREYGIYAKMGGPGWWYPQFKSAGDSSGQHELDSDHHSYFVGQWNFFVFIVDRVNHKMQIYADGVLTEETYDSYSTFNVFPTPLVVGWSREHYIEHAPFWGRMDDLRIFRRALTPSQVQFLYTHS